MAAGRPNNGPTEEPVGLAYYVGNDPAGRHVPREVWWNQPDQSVARAERRLSRSVPLEAQRAADKHDKRVLPHRNLREETPQKLGIPFNRLFAARLATP